MATKSAGLLLIVCLIGFMSMVESFELKKVQHHINLPTLIQSDSSVVKADDCKTALIYEYMSKFTLPLNDIEKLFKSQFSRNSVADVDAPNKVKFYNISTVNKLLSNDQSESYPSPLKAIVHMDQIQLDITYHVNITEPIYKKNHFYNATTKVSKVSISYEKEFKLQTGTFVINNVVFTINNSSMTSTFTPTPDSTDQALLQTAVKASSQSLYANLLKLFDVDLIKKSMETNSKGEQISKIFTTNPYNYNYYSTNISIDVSTITVSSQVPSLTNGIAGKLPQNNTFCSKFVPDFTNTGAIEFISKEFVQNFVAYSISTYPGWKNIRMDKKSIMSTVFQWELLDLEYVVDGLWNDMGEFAQNEIFFTCDVKDLIATEFSPEKNRLHQTLSWACQGFVKLNETYSQKVMDFVPTINHMTDIKVNNNPYGNPAFLSIYVNELQVIDCLFNDVVSLNQKGKYTVSQEGAKLANRFMGSMFNNFRVYTIGTWFGVSSAATKTKVESGGNGFWVL